MAALVAAAFWGGVRALYAALHSRRRALRPAATIVADALWAFCMSRAASRSLLLARDLSGTTLHPISRAIFATARHTLLMTLGPNLAAVHTDRPLKLARVLNLLYRHAIRERWPAVCGLYLQALFRTMRFDRLAEELKGREIIENHYINHIAGVAHLYASNIGLAKYFLQRAIVIYPSNVHDHRMLGRAFLLEGNYRAAAQCFERAVDIFPPGIMAHQNYAGRYDIARYRPKAWEVDQAGELSIYDNLGQLAEEFFLRGRAEVSFGLYDRMLRHQEGLARRQDIRPDLVSRLASRYPAFDPALSIRLLPYEWVTQFGHIGLLDSYRKMARLGFYPRANYVVLAPDNKVISKEYLGYWDDHFVIVRDDDLIGELFPYQRHVGDGFMAYRAMDGSTEPWTRAAARAQVSWARRQLGPLLQLTAENEAEGRATLKRLGVPQGAWYAGLHVRESGYYAESDLGISAHRNARIEDYLPAIKEITSRGGWVVRLGDKSMRALPAMPQVIDYAVSDSKSPRMDLFFCATSRFVVGTTTGLTTACLSFGCPMVLVNCISNDWQLWTDETDFIVKRIYDGRTRRFLSLAETYRAPVQGLLVNNAVMNAHGYLAVHNSPEEIAEAVRYKLDLLDGIRSRPGSSHPVLTRYGRALAANPYMFGAAHPVLPFLERHPELLEEGDRLQSARHGPRCNPAIAAMPPSKRHVSSVP